MQSTTLQIYIWSKHYSRAKRQQIISFLYDKTKIAKRATLVVQEPLLTLPEHLNSLAPELIPGF